MRIEFQYKKLVLTLACLVIICLPALWPMFTPGTYSTQDQIQIARTYQFDKAIKDGQIPPRWAPDLRYGEPTFNYYAPFPYYVGTIVHTLGFNFLQTNKILFGLSIVLSALAMFYLVKKLTDSQTAAVIAAALYTYAPYHAVDVYVRGALSESWALVFFPIIFLSFYLLIDRPSIKSLIPAALSLAALFYTHNIMALLLSPFLLGWISFWVFKKSDIQRFIWVVVAVILALGLSASYTLPAYFEKDLVNTDQLISLYYNFRGHFVAWPQFFSTFWGYGASLWGSQDDMSFQVGLVHWVILFVGLVLGGLMIRKKPIFGLMILLTGLFGFSLFMQHNRSAPIWESLSILSYTQCPWRFLGVSIFLISIIGGLGVMSLGRYKKIALLLVFPIIIFNISFFRPDKFLPNYNDQNYISDSALSSHDLPKDYLPLTVKKIDQDEQGRVKILTNPRIVEGQAEINGYLLRTASAKLQVNSHSATLIEVPITDFPDWVVSVSGQKIDKIPPSEFGLIRFELPAGEHSVKLDFKDTPIRTISNIISVLFILALISLFIIKGKNIYVKN